MRDFRALARVGIATLACAAAMLAGPVPALATSGGAESGGGDIPVAYHRAIVWRDDGTFGTDGKLIPTQGYDQTSGETFIGYMEATVGRPFTLTGVDGVGTPHRTKYWNAVNEALSRARARAGTTRARVVGVGWNWFVLKSGGGSWGFSHGGTAADLLSRAATASELPNAIGWGTSYHGTSKSWRQQIYEQAIADCPGSDMTIVVAAAADTEPEAYGTIEATKVSDQSLLEYTIHINNPAYSLGGATFGVYTERACTNQVATITTNENGVGTAKLLASRPYYLKELDPPAGHIASDGVIEIRLTPGNTTEVDVPNDTTVVDANITKKLEGLGAGETSGLVKLSGSVIQVTADFNKDGAADRTWKFESDDTGDYGVDDGSGYIGGSGLIYNDDHELVWPLAVYTVQEVEPVPGTMLEGQTDPDDEDYTAPVHSFDLTADSDGAATVDLTCTIEQPLEPIDVALKKVDADKLVVLPGDQVDIDDGVGQGNGTLEEATFEITNASGNRVVVNGEVYEDGEVVWTGATGEGGAVDLELTAGVYRIRETKAPEGYVLSSQVWQLTINPDGTSSLIKA